MVQGLSYQFSIFGNFHEITATPEVINKLMELFKEFSSVLLPVSFQQITEISNSSKNKPPIKGFNGIIFINPTKTLSITFNGGRIDIIIHKSENKEVLEKDLKDCKNDFMFLIKKVLEEYKKKASRLAIVQNLVTKEVSDEKIEMIFSKIFNLPESIMKHTKRDWNFTTTNRLQFFIKAQQETINSNITFSRSMKEPVFVDMSSNKFVLVMDLNTIPENQENRFDIDLIYDFFDNAVKKQETQIEELIKHIGL